MDDQRVEARTALGFVDLCHGFPIGSIGGEAVDGLGRHADQAAFFKTAGGEGDMLGVGGPDHAHPCGDSAGLVNVHAPCR